MKQKRACQRTARNRRAPNGGGGLRAAQATPSLCAETSPGAATGGAREPHVSSGTGAAPPTGPNSSRVSCCWHFLYAAAASFSLATVQRRTHTYAATAARAPVSAAAGRLVAPTASSQRTAQAAANERRANECTHMHTHAAAAPAPKCNTMQIRVRERASERTRKT